MDAEKGQDNGRAPPQPQQPTPPGGPAMPDFKDIKKKCTWQRLKCYIIPVAAAGIILVLAAIIGSAASSSFLTGLSKEWIVILAIVLMVSALGVALSSKFEHMYNELMDMKYTLIGLSEVVKTSMVILKDLGEFSEATKPEIRRAKEFMDSWKQSMEPMMEDIKRAIAKIEKPMAEGVKDVEKGFMSAERGIENMFHHKK